MEGTPSLAGPEVQVCSFLSSLSGVDPEGLTEPERIAAVSALEALKGAAAAAQARLTAAAVVDRETLGEDSRSVRADIALARKCSPTLADQHVGVAKALVKEMPETMAALTSGELSERRAGILVRETACLSAEHRAEVDKQLAPTMTSLGDKALAGAARRAGAALDAESLAERNRRAVASRRMSVRPAVDGMAWLSILGPMKDVIGAHVALTAEEKRRHIIDPTLSPQAWAAAAAEADSRGKGAWLADRALELLSGRAKDQPQPVEVNLVMTDKVLLPAAFGGQAPADDVAVIPGWGPISGEAARAHIADLLNHRTAAKDASTGGDDAGAARDDGAFVWLRRLFTDPSGRDLVALDSTRRRFHGGLRKFLQLRDPTCRVPWCDAPAIEADHVHPVHDGGTTTGANAGGLCKRHNQIKEEVGWYFTVRSTGLDGTRPHGIRIQTPTGRVHDSTAPPILGEGWSSPERIPDEWMDDVHLQDLPLPEDPWGGWIPDPPDDWFYLHAELVA
ncbi:HNH endonuclease signature motif containing protein [Janibacter sp. HTCC2649]|uniref:HNH endonuclease signature motif containing protein n=1 Tax=Janibacter sp. HTCC2649 TaxID=313589 RepID=UPI001ED92564|nr:HNH endonuclease signature motif containing protein [Janibacter sp. HTCC2649]